MPLINLTHVTKAYHFAETTHFVLKDIHFQLDEGELVSIIGASGSGKTTLMNIIGFLDRASSGNYFFADQDVSSFSSEQLAILRNEKIGFVFQSFFLLPRLNALQNVMLPLFYRGIPQHLAKEKALAMLDKVNVSHLALHKPNTLSGGQQQRVAIARALVNDPDVILADEPTGSLDSQTSLDVMNLFASLNQEGRTILIITHDHEVSERCLRVVTIKDGCLVS